MWTYVDKELSSQLFPLKVDETMVPMVYQWNINAKNQVLPRCDVAIGEESHAGELGIDHICILPRGQETQGETWEVSHIPTSTDLS